MDIFLKRHLVETLAFALSQVRDPTDIRNACDEFWHGLNRKSVIYNGEVDGLVADTLRVVEEHRPDEGIARKYPLAVTA